MSNSDPAKVFCSISQAQATLKIVLQSRLSHARASKARFLGMSHISQTSKASWFANVQTVQVQVVSSETRIRKTSVRMLNIFFIEKSKRDALISLPDILKSAHSINNSLIIWYVSHSENQVGHYSFWYLRESSTFSSSQSMTPN